MYDLRNSRKECTCRGAFVSVQLKGRSSKPNPMHIRWLMALLWLPVAAAAEAPLFSDDSVIRAVLTAPLAQAHAQKQQSARLYLPGTFAYLDDAGNNQRLSVSIRSRGNFRRQHCDLPPLTLNFARKEVGGSLMQGQDKLKLVSPCFNQSAYQQYVILEYLAYRTLETLTDFSFRTRLLRLSFVDSDQQLKPWTALSFVLEDQVAMADRVDLPLSRIDRVGFTDLDRDAAAVVGLFQLLIGNNDYSMLLAEGDGNCCHNVKPLRRPDTGLFVPVPYDFDFAGLVNAPYAAPPGHLPVKTVRDRYYSGLCHPEAVMERAVKLFQEKRPDINRLVETAAGLSETASAAAFVDDFFDLLDSPARMREEVLDRCRGGHLLGD